VALGKTIYGGLKAKYDSRRMQIEGQILQDGLCSAFDGGRQNTNPQNEAKLAKFLGMHFEDIIRDTRSQFDDIYKGEILLEGASSLLALMMANRDWTGPHSIRSQIQQIQDTEE
jgi:hypothetical protein